MLLNEIDELTTTYVIIKGEKIYFDEPLERLPSKEEYTKWLNNIESVLRKTIATTNK